MWKKEKLSMFTNVMHPLAKLIVLSTFFGYIYVLNDLLFNDITLVTGVVEVLSVIFYIITLKEIGKHSLDRVVVEVATYSFGMIRNKDTDVLYYMPDGCEPNESDKKKRIYKFEW